MLNGTDPSRCQRTLSGPAVRHIVPSYQVINRSNGVLWSRLSVGMGQPITFSPTQLYGLALAVSLNRFVGADGLHADLNEMPVATR